jgi:hypothetical protein
MDIELKHAYLKEAYSKTYDELLFRIRTRDNWIKVQLVCQLTLVAVSSGLKLQIINNDHPLPNALSFCIPVSFVVFLLFQIEETIIALLSRYLGEMSAAEEALNPGYLVHNFDSSVAVSDFWTKSQVFRTLSISVIFLLIPAILWLYRAYAIKYDISFIFEAAISFIFLGFIATNIVRAHNARRQNARSAPKLDADLVGVGLKSEA